MRQSFLAVLVTAFLCVASIGLSSTPSARTAVLKNFEVGTCTVWPVEYHETLAYLTDLHCVLRAFGKMSVSGDLSIEGIPAEIIKVDAELALLSGGPSMETFEIAKSLPKIGDPVFSRSQPYGGPEIFVRGFYSAPEIPTTPKFSLFQLPAAPGSSGSPIFNAKGRVIGVIQSVPCDLGAGFCPMSLSSTLSEIQEFLK